MRFQGKACTLLGQALGAFSDLGSAGGAAGVKEQSNILLLWWVLQLSRGLLHLEPLRLWLHFHCSLQSQIKQSHSPSAQAASYGAMLCSPRITRCASALASSVDWLQLLAQFVSARSEVQADQQMDRLLQGSQAVGHLALKSRACT